MLMKAGMGRAAGVLRVAAMAPTRLRLQLASAARFGTRSGAARVPAAASEASTDGTVRLRYSEAAQVDTEAQKREVTKAIVNKKVFTMDVAKQEVDWFYGMELQKSYFSRFGADEIANHIQSFIAAKKLAATTVDPENIWLDMASEDGSDAVLYMTPVEAEKQLLIERRLLQRVQAVPNDTPVSIEFFQSNKPIVPGGRKKLGIYYLKMSRWANPKAYGTQQSALEEVASVDFLRAQSAEVKQNYAEIIEKAMQQPGPVEKVLPRASDGSTPIMFAFKHGGSLRYIAQVSQLLRANHLSASRKFVETFANGLTVHTLYLENVSAEDENVRTFQREFSLLYCVPFTPTLTPLYNEGKFTPQQYTYAVTVSRFLYYFLLRRTEEFTALSKTFAKDPLSLGRLRNLQRSLKREAVSHERIRHCIMEYPTLFNEIFADFYKNISTKRAADEPAKFNEELAKKIKKEAVMDMDAQIMTAMLTFNMHVLKTNFFKLDKSALAFRMDPKFMQEGDWPAIPFGIFFVVGSEFQGFHVRFRDISRGGIRIVRSADKQAYNANLEGQFVENYNLAYTQNLKNKDIPEFGSKGTILLEVGVQNLFLPFQKYVSALVDLMLLTDDVIDNYGREELLFLGPDEWTADYMEYAALYAKSRGYKYWRSFTTGKPASIGGVPHDRYGMTTRSTHRMVLGALAKLNLPEESVTKGMTGGPDGDLGSNEILMSTDRTLWIVDGSGVVYDPNGLDRVEMTRLAKQRKMVEHFEPAKLSSGGFRVLIKDNNVTLPSGEVVESGVQFRNEFHLHPLSSADVFVPCGGRPEAVTLRNVKKMFDEKGKPRFRIIVEGANLFITQDARMVLEDAGVILYKDASANKGGVTSSAKEVLAALTITDDAEFEPRLAVHDVANPPAFYRQYVKEICATVEKNADDEFECVWREHQRTGTYRCVLTDQVSTKINELNDFIQASSLWKNKKIRRAVLADAVPQLLVKEFGIDAVMKRVPENYLQAIFGAFLASKYVYKYGLAGNEMQFFEFMQQYIK